MNGSLEQGSRRRQSSLPPCNNVAPAPPNQSFAASCRQVHIAQARGDGSVVDNHCRRATV